MRIDVLSKAKDICSKVIKKEGCIAKPINHEGMVDRPGLEPGA